MSNNSMVVEEENIFSIFFRIDQQEPFQLDGLDEQTYNRLISCDYVAHECIQNLISTKEMTYDGSDVPTFFRSPDGVEFSRIEISISSRETYDNIPERNGNERTEHNDWEDIPDPDDMKLLENKCKKHAFSDGKFFCIDMEKSSFRGIVVGICQLCVSHKTIRGSFRSPSNFATHIKRVHRNDYEAFLNHRKTLAQQKHARDRETRTVTCQFSQRSFETNVTNYIIESMAPISTVEMASFRYIFDALGIKQNNRKLKHMSRRTLCKRIENLYKDQMEKISIYLRDDAIYVCTTADIWTSRRRRFIGVTGHWIDSESLQRKSVAIACRRFPGAHSAERIADILTDIHASFGLDSNKIVATVTDNGSNFVKAFREFGANTVFDSCLDDVYFYIQDEHLDLDEDAPPHVSLPSTSDSVMDVDEPSNDDQASYLEDCDFSLVLPKHLRCASHTLHLIATVDLLKIIKASTYLSAAHFGALEKCTALWNVLRSPKSSEIINEHLEKSLIRPVITRWNSMFDALERIVASKEQIIQVSPLVGITNVLTESDFRYLEEYVNILKPLAVTTDLLQGEDLCYYGYLLPSLVSLKRKLNAMYQSNYDTNARFGPLITGLIKSLENRFRSFFAVEDEVSGAAIAAVCHPRFKLRWLATFSDSIRRKEDKWVLNAAAEERSKVTEARSPVVVAQEKDDLFDLGDESELPDQITSRTVSVEIAKYIASPKTDLEMLNEFPVIKKVFIQYNTPLPSSAPVERLFSYATMMNLPKWNRLSDMHFEQRVLMKANAVKDSHLTNRR